MRSTQSSRCDAFTLKDLMFIIAGVAVVLVFGVWLLAAIAKARHGPVMRVSCMNNLKQVGLAFRQWALDHDDKFTMQVPVANGGTLEHVEAGAVFPHYLVMSNELLSPKLLICPDDTTRSKAYARARKLKIDSFDRFPTNFIVSYFVGVDADSSRPEMFLTGDDNFAIRGEQVQSGLVRIWTNSLLSWTTDRHTPSTFGDPTLPPKWGNVTLADGSVRQLSDQLLRVTLVKTGMATNRLAMP